MNRSKELEIKLKEASDAYYNTDRKIMSDEEYDKLANEYYELTGDVIVGATPKVAHTVAVSHKYDDLAGTLAKSQNIDDIVKWLNKHKQLVKNHYNLIVTLKYDGNSVIEEYNKDGELKVALTRGEDGKGKDVTNIMKLIPHKYNKRISNEKGVKVEVIMTYENFDKFIEDTGKEYANPRSIVAGIFNNDDGYKYAKYLTVVPLWLRGEEIKDRNDEVLEANIMSNIQSNHTYRIEGTLDEVVNDIQNLYEYYDKKRLNDLGFMIDGIVIEFADKDIRDTLGFTNSKKDIPKYAIALKFPYMEKKSKVKDIEFWVSENGTGLITPVCYFEPVEFLGATHQKQSLQNYKRFKELNLGKGSPILVQLRNDVLTYIEKLDTDEDIEPIPFTTRCPACGGDVVIDVNDNGEETRARCSNPACHTKVKGMIINYLNKIGVKGINTATVYSLYEEGVIKDIVDMYTCKEADMCRVLGPVAGKKAKEALFAVSTVFDYQLIGSLNIDNFGRSTSQLLFKEITWFEFNSLLDEPDKLKSIMMNIDGIGPKKTEVFLREIKGLRGIIDKLTIMLNVKSYKNTLKISDKTYSFVITGKLSRKRDDIVEELKSKGHKVTGSVTKNTDYLINNDINSTTGKNKKAKELGIPIITEDELTKLI